MHIFVVKCRIMLTLLSIVSGSVVKTLVFLPVTRDSSAAARRVKPWRQEGHPADNGPVHHGSPSVIVGVSEPL